MLHFIRVCTVCLRLKQHSRTERDHNSENSTCDPLKYTQWAVPFYTYQYVCESPSEYKGLTMGKYQNYTSQLHSYCPASQERQWRHVFFTKLSGLTFLVPFKIGLIHT